VSNELAKAIPSLDAKSLASRLCEALSFELTTAQQRVWTQIGKDLQAS
jgi:RecG-like helicase